MLHDLRFGFRMIRCNPSFALAAIFTLALGIGAATLIFSVGASLLLDPFPYRDAGRLVRFYYHSLRPNGYSGAAEFPLNEYRDFRAAARGFETIGFRTANLQYVHGEGAQQVPAAWVTTNTFAFLGVAPLLGRPILRDDENPAAPAVCVVSYRFWQEQLQGAPAAIGTTLTFDGQPRILAGVMPLRFAFLGVPVWLPFRERGGPGQSSDPHIALQPLARLKPGVTLAAATAELDAIEHQLARSYPQDYPDPRFTVSLRTLADAAVGGLRPLLYSLFAAVATLLLIASSNAANLLLARASAREREIAIRAAAGATRGRLVRQLLVESGILAAAAGALGCGLASFALVGLPKLLPAGAVPDEAVFGLNRTALWFALGVTAATTLLCGLAPALHAARAPIRAARQLPAAIGQAARRAGDRGGRAFGGAADRRRIDDAHLLRPHPCGPGLRSG
ncbi:MAG: ABC transporter permease [Bryobacteraceae bacterium]